MPKPFHHSFNGFPEHDLDNALSAGDLIFDLKRALEIEGKEAGGDYADKATID